MKVSEFYNTQYVDYSSYDNLRKIASYIDGQKNASRKILHTILEKNMNKSLIKVSRLASKVEDYTEYLHGDISGVVVTLGQDFTGTNNLPLLKKDGNFGTRFSPHASASRYIHTVGSKDFFELFKKEDSEILKQQYFEGLRIEPMFYIPTLPILLINGSEGVSSGFAQKILPRDPEKIRHYIKQKLLGRNPRYDFTPFFKGFNGVIEQGDSSAQWLIKGVIKRKGVNKVEILEVPIGYDLKGYINVLDTLEDKKVIQSYRDKSEDDIFSFEVTIPSKNLKTWSDEEILQKLKLIKKVTENYTVIDESNKINDRITSAKEIADAFIDIKIKHMGLRKVNVLNKIQESIKFDQSKYDFIKAVVDGKLIINKRKKSDVEKDLNKMTNILQKEGSYDYLLNMNIMSLTLERMQKLSDSIKESQQKYKDLQQKSNEQMWLDEL